jgi:hypothetical protein
MTRHQFLNAFIGGAGGAGEAIPPQAHRLAYDRSPIVQHSVLKNRYTPADVANLERLAGQAEADQKLAASASAASKRIASAHVAIHGIHSSHQLAAQQMGLRVLDTDLSFAKATALNQNAASAKLASAGGFMGRMTESKRALYG